MRASGWFAAAAVVLAFSAAALAGEEAPAHGGIAFEPGTPKWADVLAKAKAEGKPVFVDFSTEWCGWCRKLEKDTFSQPAVGEAMKAFVNVSLDAEKGEGPELAKRYGVGGFPTLVVVDAAGEEIDRLVGYSPPEPFLKEIRRILSGEGTLPALRKALAERPDDVDAALGLAKKLSDSRREEALALAEATEKKVQGKDRAAEAKALMVQMQILSETGEAARAAAIGTRLVEAFGDTEQAREAVEVLLLGRLREARGAEPDGDAVIAYAQELRGKVKDGAFSPQVERLLVNIHQMSAQQGLARMAAAAGDDPQALNEAAWTAFQMKLNLTAAAEWARKAVELSKRDPSILDTLASIQAEQGYLDEAIELAQEAFDRAEEPQLKVSCEESLAKFKAVRDVRKARGRTVIPATPTVPMQPAKPAPAGDGK